MKIDPGVKTARKTSSSASKKNGAPDIAPNLEDTFTRTSNEQAEIHLIDEHLTKLRVQEQLHQAKIQSVWVQLQMQLYKIWNDIWLQRQKLYDQAFKEWQKMINA